MKSQDIQTNRMVAYIKEHGFKARVRIVEKEPGYHVEVLEGEMLYSKNGDEYTQWEAIAPDWSEVRYWLGY